MIWDPAEQKGTYWKVNLILITYKKSCPKTPHDNSFNLRPLNIQKAVSTLLPALGGRHRWKRWLLSDFFIPTFDIIWKEDTPYIPRVSFTLEKREQNRQVNTFQCQLEAHCKVSSVPISHLNCVGCQTQTWFTWQGSIVNLSWISNICVKKYKLVRTQLNNLRQDVNFLCAAN